MQQLNIFDKYKQVKVNGIYCNVLDEDKYNYIISYYGRKEVIAKESVEYNNFLKEKIDKAIELLKTFEPEEGYYLAFSGGKDSCAIYHLAKIAKVKFNAYYNLTTLDMHELVRLIKDYYPDVIINYPKESMWKLIIRKGIPPTRRIRYCCSELKESGGDGRFVITGVRWAESSKRKNKRAKIELNSFSKYINKINDNDIARMQIENCQLRSKHIINPIIDWDDEDVYSFIKSYNDTEYIYYPSDLYDIYDRLGCIGCPLTSIENRKKEFKRYPKYKISYIKAFERMIQERKRRNMKILWKSGEEVFDWWMTEPESKKHKQIENQINIENLESEIIV